MFECRACVGLIVFCLMIVTAYTHARIYALVAQAGIYARLSRFTGLPPFYSVPGALEARCRSSSCFRISSTFCAWFGLRRFAKEAICQRGIKDAKEVSGVGGGRRASGGASGVGDGTKIGFPPAPLFEFVFEMF